MLRAWNKKHKKLIEARLVDEDIVYQSMKSDEWIYPDISIPFDIKLIMKQKGLKELRVFHKKKHERDGSIVKSHFYTETLEWLDIDRLNESEMHKLCKEGVYYDVCDDLINILYHKENKRISEVCGGGWDYEYEEHLDTSTNSKIADLVIKFKKEHPILGKGILFEVQLSFQNQERTNKRTTERILRGYSVAWLWEGQFGTDNKLLKKEIMVFPFRDELERYDEVLDENITKKYIQFEDFVESRLKKIKEEKEKNAVEFGAIKNKALLILKELFIDEEKKLTEDFRKLLDNKLKSYDLEIKSKSDNYISKYFSNNEGKMETIIQNKIKENIEKKYESVIIKDLNPSLNNLKIKIENGLDKLKNENQNNLNLKAKEILSKENVDGIINKYIQDAIKETFGNFTENLSNSFNLISCPACKSKVPINYLKWMPFEKKQAWCLDCYNKYKSENSKKEGEKIKRGLLNYGR